MNWMDEVLAERLRDPLRNKGLDNPFLIQEIF